MIIKQKSQIKIHFTCNISVTDEEIQ